MSLCRINMDQFSMKNKKTIAGNVNLASNRNYNHGAIILFM